MSGYSGVRRAGFVVGAGLLMLAARPSLLRLRGGREQCSGISKIASRLRIDLKGSGLDNVALIGRRVEIKFEIAGVLYDAGIRAGEKDMPVSFLVSKPFLPFHPMVDAITGFFFEGKKYVLP